LAVSLKSFAASQRKKEDIMPYIKRPPETIDRSLLLEEPVSELLDDYARFIDSTPDHVVNTALRKVLWKDPEYRKWRNEQRGVEPKKETNNSTRVQKPA